MPERPFNAVTTATSIDDRSRHWTREAIATLKAERAREAETPMLRLDLPAFPGIALYLKDESAHPTGSLKHRLAMSLFSYMLCNGAIGPDTTLVEASSGSTAISEAYFARLLGLRFQCVVPASTATAKLEAIRAQGGEIHTVASAREVYAEAQRLAGRPGGLYLDQFTNAERASDWRSGNLPEGMLAQMARDGHAEPRWFVCGAGTGGTSATIGRHIRYRGLSSRLCVADPVHSVSHSHFHDCRVLILDEGRSSLIEGIGRPRVEPSFLRGVIDRMIAVEDAQSIAAMRVLSDLLGRKVGGSTGTNFWACVMLAREMADRGEKGAIATLICDDGERYATTCHDDDWLAARKVAWQPETEALNALAGLNAQPPHPM